MLQQWNELDGWTDYRGRLLLYYYPFNGLWNPGNFCLAKLNNRNTRKRCKICSKLSLKTPERRQWCLSSVFIVNFEHILHHFLVFLLPNLNRKIFAYGITITVFLFILSFFLNFLIFTWYIFLSIIIVWW